MSGCHVPEVECPCLCHRVIYPTDYDFSGFVCCDCHKNKVFTGMQGHAGNILRQDPILTMHPTQVLVDKFEDRIKKLESDHLDKLNPHAFLILKTAIDKLRKEFEEKLDVDMDKWKQYFSEVHQSKKPHKCPNCEGIGEFKNDELLLGQRLKTTQRQDATGCYDMCQSCQGKGIVWG